MKDENFSAYVCLTIKDRIMKNLEILRKQIVNTSIKKKSTRGSRHKKVENLAGEGIEKRIKEGKQEILMHQFLWMKNLRMKLRNHC